MESRRPLGDFDTLGFSLAYELGCTNILEMLRLSGLPPTWRERSAAEGGAEGAAADGRPWDVGAGSAPLVFAGGPTATSNPEPFADFFDFFALGDGGCGGWPLGMVGVALGDGGWGWECRVWHGNAARARA